MQASILVAADERRTVTPVRLSFQQMQIVATRRDAMLDFKVKVCLTVDTEFSIGGAFLDPARYRPVGEQRVWCHVGERSHGLGFLLDELDRHALPATFFVESLHVAYFKNSTMPGIAREIAARGHAVELHAHPCWLTFQDAA